MKNINIEDSLNLFIGSYFKRNRKLKKISGKQLGTMLNLSQQQISRYENGNTPFTIELMIKLSEILNINTIELFRNIEKWLIKNKNKNNQ
ncbi:helix-turn-helix domain-containing protein [Proteus myxofaciens]|uniref:HTH cro/C1-type domain-containing protein n=1 Tax=Proteus myxofaciens ATCC 19692 TaxID=1354337 RepID=A0A198FLG2_9GAMM|nr:helix-turn-helix transcriptional regulator [Proteus myxofaciens]OAT25703.1 hypothetical protein M983_2289 [Proteus myxofaciens ATCC 19692]